MATSGEISLLITAQDQASKAFQSIKTALGGLAKSAESTSATYADLAKAMVMRDDAARQIKAVQTELKETGKQGQDTTKAMERLSDALKLKDEATSQLKNIQREMQATGQGASRMGEQIKAAFMGALGGISAAGMISGAINAVKGAVSQVVGVVASGVSGAGEFETYQTQLGVLLDSTDAAKQRLAELAEFGQKTPFELPEIVKAEKVLVAFGLTADDVASKFGKSGEQIRTIVGDVASGTGARFEEVAGYIGRFASGSTGEAIMRFQELGIVTRKELSEMGLEFSKAGQLMTPVEEATTVLLQVMQEKFGGMMDAQSQTFEGMQSNLADWWGQTKRIIAEPIFDVLKESLGNLLTVLSGSEAQAGIQAIASSMAILAKEAGEIVLALSKGDIEGALGRMVGSDTASGLIAIADALGKIREATAGVKEAQANNPLQGLLPDTGSLGNIGTIVDSIGRGREEFQQLQETLSGAGPALQNFAAQMGILGPASQTAATATQSANVAASNYSMTLSTSALVARKLGDEAKYGGTGVQTLAMDLTNARAAAEQFNVGTQMIATNLQNVAMQAQNQATIMASAFSSEAVMGAMLQMDALIAEHQAQVVAQQEQAAMQADQAAFARNANQLLAEQQFQQQRLMAEAGNQAQLEALRAQGDAKKIAKAEAAANAEIAQMDAKHQASIAQAENQADVQGQIQERAMLIQEYQQAVSYQKQLTQQHDSMLRTIAMEVQKADRWVQLEAAKQDEILKLIYFGGSAQLKAEYETQKKITEITQQAATGQVKAVGEAVKTMMDMYSGKVTDAGAAVQAAQERINAFKLTPPALPALDLSRFQGSIGAAVSAGTGAGRAVGGATKTASTKVLSDMAEDLDKGVQAAQKAIAKLVDFEVPAAVGQGVQRLKEFMIGVQAALKEIFTGTKLSDAQIMEQATNSMNKVMESVTAFLKIEQTLRKKPNIALAKEWQMAYRELSLLILGAARDAENQFGGYGKLKHAQESARKMQYALEGLATAVTAMADPPKTIPDTGAWKEFITNAIKMSVEVAVDVLDSVGTVDIERAYNQVEHFKALLTLVSTEVNPETPNVSNLTNWQRNVSAAVLAAVGAVNGVIDELGLFNLQTASDATADFKALIELINTAIKPEVPAKAVNWSEWRAVVNTAVLEAMGLIDDLDELKTLADVEDAAKASESIKALLNFVSEAVKAPTVPTKAVDWDTWEDTLTNYVLRGVEGINSALERLTTESEAGIDRAKQAAAATGDLKAIADFVSTSFTVGTVESKDLGGWARWSSKVANFVLRGIEAIDQIMRRLKTDAQGGADRIKETLPSIEGLQTLIDIMGKNMTIGEVGTKDLGGWARWASQFANFVLRGVEAIDQAMRRLTTEAKSGADRVKDAGEVTGSLKSIMDVLTFDTTKIMPVGANFGQIVNSALTGLLVGVRMIVPKLEELKTEFTIVRNEVSTDLLAEAAETAKSISGIFDIFGIMDLFKDKDMPDFSKINISTTLQPFLENLKAALPDITKTLEEIKTQSLTAINSVQPVADAIKGLTEALAGIAENLGSAWENGMINLSVLATLLGQLNQAGAILGWGSSIPGTEVPQIGGGPNPLIEKFDALLAKIDHLTEVVEEKELSVVVETSSSAKNANLAYAASYGY